MKNKQYNSITKNSEFKDIHINLYNIDLAVKYYFDNVIKLNVGTENEIIKVPLKYASEERWKNIRRNNSRNTDTKQLELPLIIYRRTSVAKDDNMPGNKIDPLNPQLYHSVTSEYNSKNKYSNFFKLHDKKPAKNIHKIIMPDYVTLSYEFIAWTALGEEMNKIIEAINYHAGSYWGNDQFKFITKIDDYSYDISNAAKTDRYAISNFSMTIKGYLVPDVYKKVRSNQSIPAIKKVVFKESTNL